MESTVLSVAQGFNLKYTKSKVYKDKFGHVCITPQGAVRIQRGSGRRLHSHGHGAKSGSDMDVFAILFQHEVKERLHESGFAVDRFLISSHDMPYFKADGDVYTACFVQSGVNINFTDGPAFLDVVAHIAKMHHALSRANIDAVSARASKNNSEAARKSTLANIESLKKKLLKSGRFSDFDMLFLRGYEKFAPHIVAFGDESGHEHICHNLLKEENIYMQGDSQFAITNFAETAQAHCLHDLAYIIKRYIKAKPMEIMPIGRILDIYAANCLMPLDDALFRRILLYPDKFIKVTNDYYSKKRSFAPNTYITRMQECLRAGTVLAESL